jgi:hypothetical protein
MKHLAIAITTGMVVFAMALLMMIGMLWFDAKNLKQSLPQEPVRYEKVDPAYE